MKINTPSLGLICKGQIDKIENNYMQLFSQMGERDLKYLSKWAEYKTYLTNRTIPLSKNVKYVTEPFITAVTKQMETLIKIYVEESANNNVDFIDFKGILFSSGLGCTIEMKGHTTSYSLFDKNTGVPIVTGEFNFGDGIDNWRENCYYLSVAEKNFNETLITGTVTYFIASILFQKMVDKKEIIIVPPRGKFKTKQEKYVNENPTGVEVWDSHMFNTYVRLEGFPVEGHFRHQRVGEGRTKHKLIWINEFEKHGYNYKQLKNLPN